MNIWQQLFPKQEANPPKSMIGCGVAYLLLLIACILLMYLFGAGLRVAGNDDAPKPVDAPTQQEQPK